MDGARLPSPPALHPVRHGPRRHRRGRTGLLLAALLWAGLLLALPGAATAQSLQTSLDELAERLYTALLNPQAGGAAVVDATPPLAEAAPAAPEAPPATQAEAPAAPQPDPVQADAVTAASTPAQEAPADTAPADAASTAEASAAPTTADTAATAEAPSAPAPADTEPTPETPATATEEPATATEAAAPATDPAAEDTDVAETAAAEPAPQVSTPEPAPPQSPPDAVQPVALGGEAPTPDGVLILAVADFQNLRGDVCDLGRFTAERMVTALAARQGLRVLPRRRLREVLRETGLGSPDLLTTADLDTLGAALPAHALLMGALTDLGPTLELDVRAIALHDGSTRFAGFTGFNKTVALDDLREGQCTPAMDEEPEAEVIAATDRDAAEAAAAAEPPPPPPPPLPAYETPQYRLVVESVTSLDDSVTILMTVENLTQSALAVSFRTGSYLLDENGDRWNQMFPDTARLWAWGDDFKLVELLPGLKRRTKLRYQALAGATGEVFSLIGEEYRPQSGRVVTIPEVRLTPFTVRTAGAMAPADTQGLETRGNTAP